ncbi:BglG family transcription antiterminator [Marinilactibacillus kalidii]|uniref:BglG family transcription antiterminator n=1 Tax=Marinilactibacillus kalidii TaxID=2820274 RepID=UPI001ABE7A33|nr:BglG family transcription antiterminator [Marinilactibacillus kalidii]
MKDRTLKTLTRLMDSDLPLSIETLKVEMNVSPRTIRNEINEINDFLEGEGISRVQTIRGKGFILAITDNERANIQSLTDLDHSEAYLSRDERIFDLILSFSLSTEPVFCYQKEIDYQISKSTMDEDMRRVRKLLRQYDIEVVSTIKQGILLKGTERSIRTMIYDVINKSVGSIAITTGKRAETVIENLLNRYIPKETFTTLDQIYDQTISSTEESAYRDQMILFTAVWISRYSAKQVIVKSSTDLKQKKHSKMKAYTETLCTVLDVCPPEQERQYINFMLESFTSENTTESIEWVQAQLLSIQLIRHVEQATNIPFTRKEESLHEGLYKHILGLINRVKNHIQMVNPLKETIQNYYREVYRAIQTFTPQVEQITGEQLTDDEIAFLTIHFSASVSAINQDLKYTYKAVIVCNHGTVTGKLLSENLKEQFNIDIVGVLSSREIHLIEKLDVDVVFSTLALTYEQKPLLVLDPIIREEDKQTIEAFLTKHQQFKRLTNHTVDATDLFQAFIDIIKQSGGSVSGKIYQSMEKLFDTHQLKINKKEIQPMLKDILEDKDILLSEQAADWSDAIRKVSVPLLEKAIIEERYVDAMIQSVEEYGPYIVIGEHIALAHARPEDGVNKLGVSVATLEEPIVFGNEDNDPVKIIFCLAAVDAYSHLNIMKNLVDLINDKEKIEEMVQCKDIQQFKKILYSEQSKITETGR